MTKFKVTWEIYDKNSKIVNEIGSFDTLKAAQEAISKHIKSRDIHASPYYRMWCVNDTWTIDYGKHNAFYKIECK
ncbi:hypothetical protein KUF97_09660 [Streptococcus equi subsp. zooepidemicus]|uniref:hypothetical protein n=1 Tax=Streptococcus equi TaxID=1336 RepID=UPI001E40562B|nr:hypothetical protein [Streptococcus equi]MCD3414370.1 hypothetical protein [Streptococcus equi subsp. zooepidemicus]